MLKTESIIKLSSSPLSPSTSVYSIIPTTADYQTLKDNFVVLVARILVKHLPYFAEDFKGLVERHIVHNYSREMAKKSKVVDR